MPSFTVETQIHAPVERCFDLARSVDLHTQSSHTPERVVAGRMTGLLELGEVVTWEARHFWIHQRLTARIVAMNRPEGFSVEMVAGPFACHTHDFVFTARAETATLMREVFQFRSPLGPLGWIADRLVLKPYLKRFVRMRNGFLKRVAEAGST